MKRAIVSQTRIPEPDRDRGSQRVDDLIEFLLDEGWAVTFLAQEANADERHANRLRQRGVTTFAGFEVAEQVLAAGAFDLAVLAFWEPASHLLPLLREHSPSTRVLIDSIDVHFLRDARRRFGVDGTLDDGYGKLLAAELNTYRQADAVMTVSAKESALLADFLGPGKVFELPLAERIERSPLPFRERRGMFFVGNFRHLPNGEAIEYLCHDVLPRLEPALLTAHPLTVVGNRLDDRVRAHAGGLPNVHMVGWVPSIVPYLERARVCVVPLLHGAGVKGKVVQSLFAGTPVVGTPIAMEGLPVRHDTHALVVESPEDLAAALTRVLVDEATWNRLADAGWMLLGESHDMSRVRQQFLAIVDHVLHRPAAVAPDAFRHERRRAEAYRETVAAVHTAVDGVTEPGSVVLVVSKGDDELVRLVGRTGWHFPLGPDRGWAGFHPADSESAIHQVETLRQRGATHLVLPSTAFWWLHHYPAFDAFLNSTARRVHADQHAVVFDLRAPHGRTSPTTAEAVDGEGPEVLVLGTYDGRRAGPPPSLLRALESSRCRVSQRWRPSDGNSPVDRIGNEPDLPAVDWVVALEDSALLPGNFLDQLVAAAAELGAERVQPAHRSGPAAAPPVTERLRGCAARQVAGPTSLPVLAVRAGAEARGPVMLLDELVIGLAATLEPDDDTLRCSRVLDVVVRDGDHLRRTLRRSPATGTPRISVLVGTYDRPELLAGCLDGFAAQTLDAAEFEVVVVDDGSPGTATAGVLEARLGNLPLVWAHIQHAGRSPAKNLAALLARADIVLFCDDDDRPAPDLLEQHLRAHDAHPDEGVAVLGHTGWAPEIVVTPLMHYVTDVDGFLFSYANLSAGQQLDWRGFWEGRVSCKRSLLARHGLHDQRLDYSIDVEMAWRLAPRGLRVVYHPAARTFMVRSIGLDEFCRRTEAKGRAQAIMATLHDGEELRRYAQVEQARERWEAARPGFPAMRARARELEEAVVAGSPDADREGLHRAYRALILASSAKGVTEALGGVPTAARAVDPPPAPTPSRDRPAPAGPTVTEWSTGTQEPSSGTVALTVTLPVWSRTRELADMAVRTVARVREVARVPTEVLVVDNGSPHQRSFPAVVHRFEENRGVSVAWNTGIRAARAPVVAVLNSDCLVEPGWDEALLEAVTTGRRIAFPYTDHGDGLGFRQPDQGGTAGWCFMLTLDTYREVGPFDEQFSPAYGEDTDYWHRAWELGVELTPVPAARVSHVRRTTAAHDPHVDWLLQAHRFLYGWKHGVDPLRAPPYYNREIVEYHVRASQVVTT
ncbi:MAG: glycosyltransferase [Actinobacteria bacterium]|nr:glycosyltransferase [Actinomycetota bacterium]